MHEKKPFRLPYANLYVIKKFPFFFSVAWFQLTKTASQSDLIISDECMSVTGTTVEYRTLCGSIAFSRGTHYWEVTVERHTGNADVVVGVAQNAFNRHIMLGITFLFSIFSFSLFNPFKKS